MDEWLITGDMNQLTSVSFDASFPAALLPAQPVVENHYFKRLDSPFWFPFDHKDV